MTVRGAMLIVILLSLARPAYAQSYSVSGTFDFLRVEMRVDDDARVAHVRLTNTSANVITLGWATFSGGIARPARGSTLLPFRGAVVEPKRDLVTLEPLVIELKPGAGLAGKMELMLPEPSDGPFTHWCYSGSFVAKGDYSTFQLCERVGS